jgi:hypothetical protein
MGILFFRHALDKRDVIFICNNNRFTLVEVTVHLEKERPLFRRLSYHIFGGFAQTGIVHDADWGFPCLLKRIVQQ